MTRSVCVHKDVLHFGDLLRYFLAALAHNMPFKRLQPGHWEVKEFFMQKLLPFFNPFDQHEVLQK